MARIDGGLDSVHAAGLSAILGILAAFAWGIKPMPRHWLRNADAMEGPGESYPNEPGEPYDGEDGDIENDDMPF
jgi:hypothetical protein